MFLLFSDFFSKEMVKIANGEKKQQIWAYVLRQIESNISIFLANRGYVPPGGFPETLSLWHLQVSQQSLKKKKREKNSPFFSPFPPN